MKRILLSFLALGLLAGVASADHRHGGRGRNHGGVTWSGGVSVHTTPVRVYQQPRRVYVERTRLVRRPIYVQRPRIQYRYYNYYQRPTVITENYNSMAGYYWVSGQWSWSGAEWVWYAGHYEPDPNYVDPSYSQPSYDGSYSQPSYDSSNSQPSYDGSYYDGY